jgi:hypothetical protein
MRYGVVLVAVLGCGDNRKAPPEASIPPPPDAAEPGLPYVEMPQVPDSNHTSEVAVAASGRHVVVVATAQNYPSADSFVPPELDNDPAHPFRRIVYMTSSDSGYVYDPPKVLDPAGHTDPMIASSADGSFWASAQVTGADAADLYHSTDGGETFEHVANVTVVDKPWIAVDDTRHAVWLAAYKQHYLIGFDGTQLGRCDCGAQMSGAYADAAGGHFMGSLGFQGYVWDGVTDWQAEGAALPTGDAAEFITTASISMGLTPDGAQWSVRAMRDGMLDGPIVVRVRHFPDEGSDLTISPPGTIGFLATGALDARGRLHVAWYDSSGATGQLFYAHSLTADLQGAWSEPVLVDGNACPGNGWYPSEKFTPEGERRLREYIGIATTGGRSIIAWTHAPEAPSRVRIAYIDD